MPPRNPCVIYWPQVYHMCPSNLKSKDGDDSRQARIEIYMSGWEDIESLVQTNGWADISMAWTQCTFIDVKTLIPSARLANKIHDNDITNKPEMVIYFAWSIQFFGFLDFPAYVIRRHLEIYECIIKCNAIIRWMWICILNFYEFAVTFPLECRVGYTHKINSNPGIKNTRGYGIETTHSTK